MNWASANGLADGLESVLGPSLATLFRSEVESFSALWEGHYVTSAGEEIWTALCKETLLPAPVRTAFQGAIRSLLAAASSGHAYPVHCCPHHASQYLTLTTSISGSNPWLSTFFEVLCAAHQDIQAQLPLPLPSPRPTLSRLMRLDRFVQNHLTTTDIPSAVTTLRDHLAPTFTEPYRRTFLESGTVGMLRGRFGSYPHYRGVQHSYEKWCDNIKPFATFTERISALWTRQASPDELLRALGLPFSVGHYWIELQYIPDNAAFVRPPTHERSLAIPAPPDAAGNWAFRPDRDTPAQWNYARDLHSGLRGLPEVIHEPLPVRDIRDAIVWMNPTQSTWASPGTPYCP